MRVKRLCIDPASRSSGWAVFEGAELVRHGTVTMKGKDVDERMRQLWQSYRQIAERENPEEVYIERMNRRVHRYCLWAAFLVRTVFSIYGGTKRFEEISPGTWKKYLVESGQTLEVVREFWKADSEDEAVAIAIGFAVLEKEGARYADSA